MGEREEKKPSDYWSQLQRTMLRDKLRAIVADVFSFQNERAERIAADALSAASREAMQRLDRCSDG